MLSPVIYLLMNGLFWTLRLSGSGGSFPRPLKAAEEKMYLERCAQGDLEARNILVEHNLRLVAHIVKKYYAQTGDQDDLISIGTIGLIKGISTFKADRNVRLATYASRCIENEILMYFRAQRKLQSEVSLADTLESAGEGGSLSLMDVIAVADNMLEELDTPDAPNGRSPPSAASAGPMSPELKKRPWKNCRREWGSGRGRKAENPCGRRDSGVKKFNTRS